MSEITEKQAATRELMRQQIEAYVASLPEAEQQRRREFSELMTPARRQAFNRHIDLFVERAHRAFEGEIADYVRANPEARRALGRRIRAARKAAGMPRQRDLADEAGVGVETISRIENGGNVEVDTLAKIYGALHVPLRSPAEILLERDREWFISTLDRFVEDPDSPATESGEQPAILRPVSELEDELLARMELLKPETRDSLHKMIWELTEDAYRAKHAKQTA